MKSNKKNLLMVAALLASSSALNFDDNTDDERIGIRAEFSPEAFKTDDGHLITQDGFRVEIERVTIQGDEVDVRVKDEKELEVLLSGVSNSRSIHAPAEKAELVLNQVHFQGRVYDSQAGRLPDNGIKIAGNVPLNVVVRPGIAEELDVRFTLPTHYFDGIDWSV